MLLLVFNGRVAGISGILAGAFDRGGDGAHWRIAFLSGLIAGGSAIRFAAPFALENASGRSLFTVAVAGALVGAGTAMSGGCTSGHGICGVSRLSIRSLAATAAFMAFGFATAALWRKCSGVLP